MAVDRKIPDQPATGATTPVISSAVRFGRTGMPLFVRRWPRQRATPLHTHECSELVLVLGGSALHRDQAGDHPIRAGDVFVIHPLIQHGYAETAQLDLVNLVFDRDHFATRLGELHAMPGFRALLDLEPRARQSTGLSHALTLQAAELARLEPLVTALQHELERRQSGYRELATALFVQLLVALSRAYEARPAATANRMLRIASLVSQLEENPEAQVRVTQLAASCGMSSSALIRAFTAAVGTTPIDYAIRQRIRRGAALLESSGRTVTEIAFSVGFQDSNYFARQFRRVMGITPRDYRRGRSQG